MDRVRNQAENCDNLEGFMVYNTMGGGTGSGMGSLLREKLEDSYGKKIRTGVNIYPSDQTAVSSIEAYNSVLATHKLIQH